MISWLPCTLGRAIHQSSTFDATTLQPRSSSLLPEQISIAILELIIGRKSRSIWPPGLSCYNRKQSKSCAQAGEKRHGSSISQLKTKQAPTGARSSSAKTRTTKAEAQTNGNFDVCVIGHLRAVKDPFRTAMAARSLPDSSTIRVLQVGGAMTSEMANRAQKEVRCK